MRTRVYKVQVTKKYWQTYLYYDIIQLQFDKAVVACHKIVKRVAKVIVTESIGRRVEAYLQMLLWSALT